MSLVSLCRTIACAGSLSLVLATGLATVAQAKPSPKECAVTGLLLGDKVAAMQEALKQYKIALGDNPSAADQADYDDLAKTVDTLDTLSGGLVAIYFDVNDMPTSEELAAGKDRTLDDLVDQANACISE